MTQQPLSIFIDKILFINKSGATSVHWLYILPFDRLLAALVLITLFCGNFIIRLSSFVLSSCRLLNYLNR